MFGAAAGKCRFGTHQNDGMPTFRDRRFQDSHPLASRDSHGLLFLLERVSNSRAEAWQLVAENVGLIVRCFE